MHDEESDTFVYETLPEKFARLLGGIGVESATNEIGTGDVEKGEYYSRYYTQAPRMVTNRGSIALTGSNIDSVHIIQKG